MNDNNRKLIRDFYRSIPTAEDKQKFEAVLGMARDDRVRFTAQLVGKGAQLSPETIDAILAASSLTKQDRISIFSGAIRQFIFRWLGF